MDWLFENLGKLAPLVIFLLYMLSSLKGRKEEEEEIDPAAAERARQIQEEIRRKILERQKGSAPDGETAPRQEAPATGFREKDGKSFREGREEAYPEHARGESFRPSGPKESFRPRREVETRVPDGEWEPFRPIPPQREIEDLAEDAPSTDYLDNDPFAAQKRQIAQQMAKAEELRSKTKTAPIGSAKRPSLAEASVSVARLRQELKEGLSSPHALRKAVLLKEVLDKPPGLR